MFNGIIGIVHSDDLLSELLYGNSILPLIHHYGYSFTIAVSFYMRRLEISREAANYLRKQKMIEGRYPKIYPSATVSKVTEEETKYIRNKAFDDQYYKDLIVQYLQTYGKAKKSQIRELLWDKLPDILSDEQKNYKIGNLLASLRSKGVIATRGSSRQTSVWVLADSDSE